MSISPDPSSVRELLNSVCKYNEVMNEAVECQKKIKELTQQGSHAGQLCEKLKADIIERLTTMDCKYPHNGGWENRILFMLCELQSQAFTAGRESETRAPGVMR